MPLRKQGVSAANRNGSKSISAEIRKGTKADALRFALGANVAHGLKRTNADKRRSVELALAEWPNVSDRQIAEICAVNHHLVADARSAQLGDSPSSPEPQPRIGKDGKTRKPGPSCQGHGLCSTTAESESRLTVRERCWLAGLRCPPDKPPTCWLSGNKRVLLAWLKTRPNHLRPPVFALWRAFLFPPCQDTGHAIKTPHIET